MPLHLKGGHDANAYVPRPLPMCVLLRLQQTPSVNISRPDEFDSDFLLLSLVPVTVPLTPAPLGQAVSASTPADAASSAAAPATSNSSCTTDRGPVAATAAHLNQSTTSTTAAVPQTEAAISCLIKVCAQDHHFISWAIPDIVAKVRVQ